MKSAPLVIGRALRRAPRKIALIAALWGGAGPALRAQTNAASPAAPKTEQTVRLEEVEVNEARTSALTDAPAESRLEALRPETVIDLPTISNAMPITADYTMIASLAPSVSTLETNGPGLGEATNTMRGFKDGEYNMTYDGIPFGDISNYSHHSTAYFPAKTIGREVVDRGPGNASTLGEATFGGTIALYSKDPREDAVLVPTAAYGSFNTLFTHVEANTGLIPSANNASAVFSGQFVKSSGFRTGAYVRVGRLYLKYIQPIGKGATITVLSTVENISQGNINTLTQAQINQFGRNFNLDPRSPYASLFSPTIAYQLRTSEFSYIGLDLPFGDWKVNNKVYRIADLTPIALRSAAVGTQISPTDIGGIHNKAWTQYWGDVFDLSHSSSFGTFKTGVWYFTAKIANHSYFEDFTLGVPNVSPSITDPTIRYIAQWRTLEQGEWFTSTHVYAEYEWNVTDKFVLNAGPKYESTRRFFNYLVNSGAVNSRAFNPLYYGKTYRDLTYNLAANYRLQPDWSIYANVAKGFIAPAEAAYTVTNKKVTLPQLNRINPQETMNYQVGTVYKHDRLNADADAYWIKSKNLPVSITDPVTGNAFFSTASGATYKGVEAEATWYLGRGASLYANGSVNGAVYKNSNIDIAGVPKRTAVLGFVFNQGEWSASLTDKYVGFNKLYSSFANPDLASTLGAVAPVPGYWFADLSVGYSHKLPRGGFLRSYRIRFQANNILNRLVNQPVSVGSTGLVQYDPLPGINYDLTISGEF